MSTSSETPAQRDDARAWEGVALHLMQGTTSFSEQSLVAIGTLDRPLGAEIVKRHRFKRDDRRVGRRLAARADRAIDFRCCLSGMSAVSLREPKRLCCGVKTQ